MPIQSSTTAAATDATMATAKNLAPTPTYQRRFLISSDTFSLKRSKRFAFDARVDSMRSRIFESTSGPSSTMWSKTLATGSSNSVSSTELSPGESSRSATCSVRKPAHVFFSVVTGFAT